MKVLLDTHPLLWWFADDLRLSAFARTSIEHSENEIWVSAVCAWEIATKARIGKLSGVDRLLAEFDALLAGCGFKHLAVGTPSWRVISNSSIVTRLTACWWRKRCQKMQSYLAMTARLRHLGWLWRGEKNDKKKTQESNHWAASFSEAISASQPANAARALSFS